MYLPFPTMFDTNTYRQLTVARIDCSAGMVRARDALKSSSMSKTRRALNQRPAQNREGGATTCHAIGAARRGVGVRCDFIFPPD